MALEEVGQLINLEMRMQVPSNKPPTDLPRAAVYDSLNKGRLWCTWHGDERRCDVPNPWSNELVFEDDQDMAASADQATNCGTTGSAWLRLWLFVATQRWCWTLHCTEEQDDSLQFSPRPECSLYGEDWLCQTSLWVHNCILGLKGDLLHFKTQTNCDDETI